VVPHTKAKRTPVTTDEEYILSTNNNNDDEEEEEEDTDIWIFGSNKIRVQKPQRRVSLSKLDRRYQYVR
jgi:hypothetical protein